ncbi:MAG: hypothetical protein LBV68_00195 [Spirochaetaceae bacterium]|nr:hypothetical protein [Spirochaetaceae bacterium]
MYSGWIGERVLLNAANRWVQEAIPNIQSELPFPMKGSHYDNDIRRTGATKRSTGRLRERRANGPWIRRMLHRSAKPNCSAEERALQAGGFEQRSERSGRTALASKPGKSLCSRRPLSGGWSGRVA